MAAAKKVQIKCISLFIMCSVTIDACDSKQRKNYGEPVILRGGWLVSNVVKKDPEALKGASIAALHNSVHIKRDDGKTVLGCYVFSNNTWTDKEHSDCFMHPALLTVVGPKRFVADHYLLTIYRSGYTEYEKYWIKHLNDADAVVRKLMGVTKNKAHCSL